MKKQVSIAMLIIATLSGLAHGMSMARAREVLVEKGILKKVPEETASQQPSPAPQPEPSDPRKKRAKRRKKASQKRARTRARQAQSKRAVVRGRQRR